MARGFEVGELLEIHPGYVSGIWLRPDDKRSSRVKDTNRLLAPGRLVLVLETDGGEVLVMGCTGAVGWTWDDRLRRLGD